MVIYQDIELFTFRNNCKTSLGPVQKLDHFLMYIIKTIAPTHLQEVPWNMYWAPLAAECHDHRDAILKETPCLPMLLMASLKTSVTPIAKYPSDLLRWSPEFLVTNGGCLWLYAFNWWIESIPLRSDRHKICCLRMETEVQTIQSFTTYISYLLHLQVINTPKTTPLAKIFLFYAPLL